MASVLELLELLTDYNMLLRVEEEIRGRICHSIHRYAKENNKYMKNYNNNEESSYIQYLAANNFYGWAMSKKIPVNGFKWIENNKINEEFIKNYNESDNKGYILDVKYLKRLHELYSDLPFLSERMEISVIGVIEFNQKEWLKPCIDMNTELRKAAKNDFEKDLFKLTNNSVFCKTNWLQNQVVIL